MYWDDFALTIPGANNVVLERTLVLAWALISKSEWGNKKQDMGTTELECELVNALIELIFY